MSDYLYGLHEPGGEHLFSKPGWVVYTHELGCDPENHSGHSYPPPHTPIARLNYGYGNTGTIPPRDKYTDFSRRVRNFVEASTGCSRWIIGNEPNLAVERPNGVEITPTMYAWCFTLCRDQIRSIPGHEEDEVILAAVGPWNVESGPWLQYFTQLLERCSPDGIALHTYTHGSDPNLVFSDAKMDPPYNLCYKEFRCYRDFLAKLPEFRILPSYITETNQNGPWVDEDAGWVCSAYREIDDWNRLGGHIIKAVVLFRWPRYSEHYLDGKTNVHFDFIRAQTFEYSWKKEETMWNTFYQTSFNEGFYQYNNIGELTCPNEFTPDWEQGTEPGEWVRPEYKPKESPQPEVYSVPFSASIGTTFASHRGVLKKQLTGVKAGTRIRVSCQVMGVSFHDGGLVGGGLGQVVGIGPADKLFSSSSVVWGDWWSSDLKDSNNPFGQPWTQRTWVEVTVETIAQTDNPLLFLRSDAREMWKAQYSHFDDLLVEVWSEAPEPGGDLTLRVFLGETLLLEHEIEGLSADDLARIEVARDNLNRVLGQ